MQANMISFLIDILGRICDSINKLPNGIPSQTNDRGVSPILGTILLAGIFVILLSVLQTQAVPSWNKNVEFDHSQRVTGDLERLQSTIIAVGTTGTSRSITVELSTSYPQRMILQNLAPDPTGTLATEPNANLIMNNTTATGEIGDYWNGSQQTFTTRSFAYQANYNYYVTSPVTVYEHGILYNRFNVVNDTLTEQSLITDRRITLIMLNGSYSESGSGSTNVNIQAISSIEKSTAVSSSSSGPITISIPTRLPNSTWTELLEDEFQANGGYIADQSYRNGTPYNRLVLTLQENITYDLRLAKVGIGSSATEPEKKYITFIRKPDSTVSTGTSHLVTVEVRDTFNNPVSGVSVNASPNARFSDNSLKTDAAGQATFDYTSPTSAANETLTFSISSSPTKYQTATVIVETTTSEGDTIGPETTNVDTNVTSSSGEDVQHGTKLNLTATVSDVGRGGSDIIRAEWWSNRSNPNGGPGAGFSLIPESTDDDEFDSSLEEVINASIDTSSWDIGWHNLSVRGKDAAGNWGPESHYEINITSSGGTSSASSVQVVTASKTGSNNQRVIFTLENTGSSAVTIQNISVDSTDNPDVARIANGTRQTGAGPPTYIDEGPELRSNRTGSLLDNNGFDIGITQPLDSTSTIAAGDQTEYTLAEFRDGQNGGGAEVDPGTQVTITIGFSDGSEKTLTLNF